MSLPPSEIPLGAMRFNSDSQKLEYYDGAQWLQVSTFSPLLNGGARGIFGGGSNANAPAASIDTNVIEYINFSSTGNSQNFGDLTRRGRHACASASNTRGLFAGGYLQGSSGTNNIEYITISSTGNAQDFGDLINATWSVGSCSNQHRGIFASGAGPSNIIQYVTIASAGNAQDFGDLFNAERDYMGFSSPTRGIFGNGNPAPIALNTVEYITIATTGNSQDFGDLTTGGVYSRSTGSNGTRGIFGPRGSVPYEYVTISSRGNTTDFGDTLKVTVDSSFGSSDRTRLVTAGGDTPTAAALSIEYVTISSQGIAVNFGNLLADGASKYNTAGSCSNAHGGL
jgi:hypothetical protein